MESQICIRSSSNIYNNLLSRLMDRANGEAETTEWY